ncbi:MAG: ABC transporter permease [Alphaproteobacteria bacterium]|nr:ABC transporter permease [Alphaproteobacteria bacterium]
MRRLPPGLVALGVYLRTMVVFGLVWALASAWIGNRALLPSPLAVIDALWRVALNGELVEHAGLSVARMIVAVALAAAVAVPLGLVMAMNRLVEALVDPVVELLRPISGIAWIPLALFIFGIGHALPIYIMFYGALFPILLGTIAGVRATDRRLVDAARTMGVAWPTIVLRVVLPAALPGILVAMRLGVAAAWTAVIAAELVGAPSGLGYAIQWYRDMLVTPRVMAFIAVVGVCGYLCDAGLRWLNRRLTPWAPTLESLA